MNTQTVTEDFPLTQEELDLLNSVVEEVHQEIPVNSGALFVSETTSRFSSAIWFEKIQSKTIILAGLGGIGSWVALLLARMSPACLCLYDNDIVEEDLKVWARLKSEKPSRQFILSLKMMILILRKLWKG